MCASVCVFLGASRYPLISKTLTYNTHACIAFWCFFFLLVSLFILAIQCAVPSESKVAELHKMIEDKYAAANGSYVVSIAILDRVKLLIFFLSFLKKERSRTRVRCAPKVQQHISALYALLLNQLIIFFTFPLPYSQDDRCQIRCQRRRL